MMIDRIVFDIGLDLLLVYIIVLIGLVSSGLFCCLVEDINKLIEYVDGVFYWFKIKGCN